MPNKFSLRKLFRPKTVGNPEAQNDRHGPTTPPVASETPKRKLRWLPNCLGLKTRAFLLLLMKTKRNSLLAALQSHKIL